MVAEYNGLCFARREADLPIEKKQMICSANKDEECQEASSSEHIFPLKYKNITS
jgi:hypothetical protein